MTKKLGIVILAAGSASRMGKQKLLLPLGGKPILAYVLETAASLPDSECIAVIGEPQQQLSRLCRQHGIPWVYNAHPAAGQAASVKLGLAHLAPDVAGILFLPGDQPFLSLALLQALLQRFAACAGLDSIIAPAYQGQPRSPVLFAAAWRKKLASLIGDEGGRSIIRQNPDRVELVEWPDEHAFADADTWEDYQRLIRCRQSRSFPLPK